MKPLSVFDQLQHLEQCQPQEINQTPIGLQYISERPMIPHLGVPYRFSMHGQCFEPGRRALGQFFGKPDVRLFTDVPIYTGMYICINMG